MTDEASKALLTECFENLKITPDCQKDFINDDYKFSSTCSEKPNSSVMNLDLNSSDKPLSTDNLMCLQSEQYFDSLEISLSKCSKKPIQECKYNYINIIIFCMFVCFVCYAHVSSLHVETWKTTNTQTFFNIVC